MSDQEIIAEINATRKYLRENPQSNQTLANSLGELGRALLTRHPDILQKVQQSLQQQAASASGGGASLALSGPYTGLVSLARVSMAEQAVVTTATAATPAAAGGGGGAVGGVGLGGIGFSVGVWAFLIIVFFAPREDVLDPQTLAQLASAIQYATSMGTKIQPATSPAPKPSTKPKPTTPQECLDKATKLSKPGCLITATVIHSGGDPLADRFCEAKTNDPCEYRVRASASARYDAARFDAIRGTDVYECKCGYGSIHKRALRGEFKAQQKIDELLEQIRRQIRVSKDCGLQYRVLVSNADFGEFLRSQFGSEIDIIVDPWEPCD
jgi:hypothetical protein